MMTKKGAENMRAPEKNSILGWIAIKSMASANQDVCSDGIQRFIRYKNPRDESILELGPGEGFGFSEIVKQNEAHGGRLFSQIQALEISDKFCEILARNPLVQKHHIKIHKEDAKFIARVIPENSIDMIFGMNVVYFLNPLEDYIVPLSKVLRPGGVIFFGGKFEIVK